MKPPTNVGAMLTRYMHMKFSTDSTILPWLIVTGVTMYKFHIFKYFTGCLKHNRYLKLTEVMMPPFDLQQCYLLCLSWFISYCNYLSNINQWIVGSLLCFYSCSTALLLIWPIMLNMVLKNTNWSLSMTFYIHMYMNMPLDIVQ